MMFSFTDILNKDRALVMGILNVTPDSFSDGGEFFSSDAALRHAQAMCRDGADIIDIGCCSTAPGSSAVSLEEELARLKLVFPLIPKNVGIPVSVDTSRPEAARFALENGAVIVNDESGVFNPEMAALVKEYGAGWVFMHTGVKDSQGAKGYLDRVAAGVASFFAVTSPHGQAAASQIEQDYPEGAAADALDFFYRMRKQALKSGIDEKQLCYDYGIGFGKSRSDDALLLKSTALFSDYKPLLVGVSRKRIIGQASGVKEPEQRDYGSAAAEGIAAFLGADIIRAHNIRAAADSVRVAAVVKKGEMNG